MATVRVLVRSAALAAALLASPLPAQGPAEKAPPVFFPFPDFEDFFASPLEPLTEEQEAELAKIEIAPEDEVSLGEEVVDAYLADIKRRNIPVLTRGREVEYLQRLVEALRPLLRNAQRYESVRVYVLGTRELEARCFPGGTIVVSRGLIDFARNEAALVGILGHELSHLDQGHLLVPLKRMRLMQQTARQDGRTFDPAQFLETGQLLMRLMRPFRPEDEAAADRDGADWAYRAGYDPRQLADLFRRLHEREAKPPNFVPPLLRSHPVSSDRQEAVIRRYRELQVAEPNAGLYVGTKNLRNRVPKSEKVFAE